jgi:hypothetical protein
VFVTTPPIVTEDPVLGPIWLTRNVLVDETFPVPFPEITRFAFVDLAEIVSTFNWSTTSIPVDPETTPMVLVCKDMTMPVPEMFNDAPVIEPGVFRDAAENDPEVLKEPAEIAPEATIEIVVIAPVLSVTPETVTEVPFLASIVLTLRLVEHEILPIPAPDKTRSPFVVLAMTTSVVTLLDVIAPPLIKTDSMVTPKFVVYWSITSAKIVELKKEGL